MNTTREFTDHPDPARTLRPTIYCPPERADLCVAAMRGDRMGTTGAPNAEGQP